MRLRRAGISPQVPPRHSSCWHVTLPHVAPYDDLKPSGKKLRDQATECAFPIGELGGLYSKLCKNIHGFPWDGPGVRLLLGDLEKEEERLLRAICGNFNLGVVESRRE
jgi:hypothetical protein